MRPLTISLVVFLILLMIGYTFYTLGGCLGECCYAP